MSPISVVILLSLSLTVSAKYTVKCTFGNNDKVPDIFGFNLYGPVNEYGIPTDPPLFLYKLVLNGQDWLINGNTAYYQTHDELIPKGVCPNINYMGYPDHETSKKNALTSVEIQSDSNPSAKCTYKSEDDFSDPNQFLMEMFRQLKLQ